MERSENLAVIRAPSPPPRCARPREVENLAYIALAYFAGSFIISSKIL